jgi:T-complex protein 1 subunit delta
MLNSMSVLHPAAKMLVDLSAAQDIEAGDGTTSVVVIAGSLLGAADRLLSKGKDISWSNPVSDRKLRI